MTMSFGPRKNETRGKDGRFVPVPIEDRFWAKVEKTQGCWIWRGGAHANHNGDLYGLTIVNGKPEGAHRVAYELTKGKIESRMTIDHLCKTTLCVNPSHLEQVSQRENLMRGKTLAAQNASKTHCLKGHPLSGDNLELSSLKRGRRLCLTCKREKNRIWMRSYQKPKR